MFALTIKQPHAFHILHSGKDVENRTWKLPEYHKNQWIALHAAKTADKTVPAVNGIDSSHYGAIIGFLKFSDCLHDSDSPWAGGSAAASRFAGHYHWVIGEAKRISQPIPCRGSLGLWRVNLELIQSVNSEIYLQPSLIA
ncbi:MAG: hypothetical protein ACKN9E_13525 [Microcystaceae cyanobacterium]